VISSQGRRILAPLLEETTVRQAVFFCSPRRTQIRRLRNDIDNGKTVIVFTKETIAWMLMNLIEVENPSAHAVGFQKDVLLHLASGVYRR
jgi:hypothetical protein